MTRVPNWTPLLLSPIVTRSVSEGTPPVVARSPVVAGSPDPVTRLTEGLPYSQLGSRCLDIFTASGRPAVGQAGRAGDRPTT